MPESSKRDVAVVLSGGGINAVLLELGFLKRLREDPVWSRIGWIYGTSAGALAGTMAALYRIEVDGWSPSEAIEEMLAFGYHTYYESLINCVRDYQRGTLRN